MNPAKWLSICDRGSKRKHEAFGASATRPCIQALERRLMLSSAHWTVSGTATVPLPAGDLGSFSANGPEAVYTESPLPGYTKIRAFAAPLTSGIYRGPMLVLSLPTGALQTDGTYAAPDLVSGSSENQTFFWNSPGVDDFGANTDFFQPTNSQGATDAGIATVHTDPQSHFKTITFEFSDTGGESINGIMVGTYDVTVSGTIELTAGSPLVAKSSKWDRQKGGLIFTYAVAGPLAVDTTVELFYASGQTLDTAFNHEDPIFSTAVQVSAKQKTYTVNVPGTYFDFDHQPAPVGTTCILLIADPGGLVDPQPSVVALQDVSATLTGDAAAHSAQFPFSDTSRSVVSTLLRMAGQPRGVITSTARTPEEQVQAMFTNLVKPNGVADQRRQYKSPAGQVVIDSYVAAVSGLQRTQIPAESQSIVAAMLTTINNLPTNWGPHDVSHHCATPQEWAALNVIDIGPNSSGFGAIGKALFNRAAQFALLRGILGKYLAPSAKEPAFHLEITQ